MPKTAMDAQDSVLQAGHSAHSPGGTRVEELELELARLRNGAGRPIRRRLPETRDSVTHKFDIAGHEGYLTVGLFENGQPGELFITMAKEGSTIGGLMDCIGTLTSLALQYGVPFEALARKFAHQRFEPSGFTKNADVRYASSIIDYVFRWIASQFVPGFCGNGSSDASQSDLGPKKLPERANGVNHTECEAGATEEPRSQRQSPSNHEPRASIESRHSHPDGSGRLGIRSWYAGIAQLQQDAPICPHCGHVTVRNGACYRCLNCGESLGCS